MEGLGAFIALVVGFGTASSLISKTIDDEATGSGKSNYADRTTILKVCPRNCILALCVRATILTEHFSRL
jgi:hypothetical protein